MADTDIHNVVENSSVAQEIPERTPHVLDLSLSLKTTWEGCVRGQNERVRFLGPIVVALEEEFRLASLNTDTHAWSRCDERY